MKKHYILLAVLVVILAGVSFVAINKYENRTTGPSLAQVTAQRNTAQADVQVLRQLDTVHQQAATAQVTALTTQKATLCTQIKAAKLVQPLCK